MDFPFWVSIAPFVSKNAYHSSTYGTLKRVRCNYKQMVEKTTVGENVIKTTWMALPAKTAISEQDQITLDGHILPIITMQKVIRESDHRVEYIQLELSNTTQSV